MPASYTDKDILAAASRVRFLLMDCDGVLTDGRLFYGGSGEVVKVFHARDGEGIVQWHKAGGRSGILSGRNSPIVELRADQLAIEFVRQGIHDKLPAFEDLLAEAGIVADEVAYIGDDTPDLPVLKASGFPVAVGDAIDQAKEAAIYVTRAKGGKGAVREVTDLLLSARGLS